MINVKLRCASCDFRGGGTYLVRHPPVGSKRDCPACGKKNAATVLGPHEKVTGYASVKLTGQRLENVLDARASAHSLKYGLKEHFEKMGQPIPKHLRERAERRIAREKAE